MVVGEQQVDNEVWVRELKLEKQSKCYFIFFTKKNAIDVLKQKNIEICFDMKINRGRGSSLYMEAKVLTNQHIFVKNFVNILDIKDLL